MGHVGISIFIIKTMAENVMVDEVRDLVMEDQVFMDFAW